MINLKINKQKIKKSLIAFTLVTAITFTTTACSSKAYDFTDEFGITIPIKSGYSSLFVRHENNEVEYLLDPFQSQKLSKTNTIETDETKINAVDYYGFNNQVLVDGIVDIADNKEALTKIIEFNQDANLYQYAYREKRLLGEISKIGWYAATEKPIQQNYAQMLFTGFVKETLSTKYTCYSKDLKTKIETEDIFENMDEYPYISYNTIYNPICTYNEIQYFDDLEEQKLIKTLN